MTGGTPYGQPLGRLGGTDYLDDPDPFPAVVTAVLTAAPAGMPEVTSVRLGFRERWQDPDTGAFADKPDGRSSDGTAGWAVGVPGTTYAVGDRLTLRRHPRHQDRFQVVGAAGGARTPVRPTETRSATEAAAGAYKLAEVQRWDAAAGEYVGTGEVVRFKPYWAGMRQRVGPVWWCDDTGTRSTDTPPKRQLVGIDIPQIPRPVPTGACDPETGEPLYVVDWRNDLLQPDE